MKKIGGTPGGEFTTTGIADQKHLVQDGGMNIKRNRSIQPPEPVPAVFNAGFDDAVPAVEAYLIAGVEGTIFEGRYLVNVNHPGLPHQVYAWIADQETMADLTIRYAFRKT